MNNDIYVNPKDRGTQTADREIEGIANFLVLYESIEQKMTMCEEKMREQQVIYEQTIDEQLRKIRLVMSEFEEIMTETGAARWRVSAENALKEGQTHVELLQQACEQVEKLLNESCAKLNLAATHVANEIKYAVDSLKKGDFKRLALEGYRKISENTQHSMKRMYNFSCWLQIKAAVTALIIALIVILTVGLYASGEWPWESHERVLKARVIGQAIMDAWPNLDNSQRSMIEQITKK